MKKSFTILMLLLSIHTIGFSQCFVGGFGSLGELSKTTGNYNLDNWFNIQKNAIESVFNVEADLYIYNDYSSPNAYASNSSRADGKIAFGINMLTQYLWRMDKGKAAVAAVLAHEYGHVLQLAYNSKLNWKYRELHADFLAGYYLRTKAYVTYQDLNNFAKVFFDLGDDNFWSEGHHGTNTERLNAFKAGYNCNCSNAREAYETGENYVQGKKSTRNNTDYNNTPQYDYITVACTHLMHPGGDISPCRHPAHPNGDLYRCQHSCRNAYGYIVPCHPNGDVGPCNHPAHPNGDISQCHHKLHPNGDVKKVRKY